MKRIVTAVTVVTFLAGACSSGSSGSVDASARVGCRAFRSAQSDLADHTKTTAETVDSFRSAASDAKLADDKAPYNAMVTLLADLDADLPGAIRGDMNDVSAACAPHLD